MCSQEDLHAAAHGSSFLTAPDWEAARRPPASPSSPPFLKRCRLAVPLGIACAKVLSCEDRGHDIVSEPHL